MTSILLDEIQPQKKKLSIFRWCSVSTVPFYKSNNDQPLRQLFITSRQPTHYCENCRKEGSVPLCVANPTSLHFSFLFLQSRQHQGDVPSFVAWISENGSYAGMSKQRSWGLKMSCDWKLKEGETLTIACAVCWNSLPRLRRVSGVLSAVPPWGLR